MSAFSIYNNYIPAKQGSSFFTPLGNLSLCPHIMKVIKIQSEPNPSYFPMRNLGRERLRVWPYLIYGRLHDPNGNERGKKKAKDEIAIY